MVNKPSIIERAYALAQSGACIEVKDIVRQLKSEHYEHVEQHFASSSLKRTLKAMCTTAQAANADASGVESASAAG